MNMAFRCLVCKKEFEEYSEIHKHILNEINVKNYNEICKWCDKTYTTYKSLSCHLKVCNKRGSLKCEYCYLRSDDQEKLDKHVEIAHKTKPQVQCTRCSCYFNIVYLPIHLQNCDC